MHILDVIAHRMKWRKQKIGNKFPLTDANRIHNQNVWLIRIVQKYANTVQSICPMPIHITTVYAELTETDTEKNVIIHKKIFESV